MTFMSGDHGVNQERNAALEAQVQQLRGGYWVRAGGVGQFGSDVVSLPRDLSGTEVTGMGWNRRFGACPDPPATTTSPQQSQEMTPQKKLLPPRNGPKLQVADIQTWQELSMRVQTCQVIVRNFNVLTLIAD